MALLYKKWASKLFLVSKSRTSSTKVFLSFGPWESAANTAWNTQVWVLTPDTANSNPDTWLFTPILCTSSQSSQEPSLESTMIDFVAQAHVEFFPIKNIDAATNGAGVGGKAEKKT